jgi:hypothetical protein
MGKSVLSAALACLREMKGKGPAARSSPMMMES